MSEAPMDKPSHEPTFRCRCGYQLFRGQDCPECGRSFEQAVGPKPPIPGPVKVLTGLAGTFLLLPFCGCCIAHPPYPFAFIGPMIGGWLISCIAATAGCLAVSRHVRVHERTRGLAACFIVNASIISLYVEVAASFILAMVF